MNTFKNIVKAFFFLIILSVFGLAGWQNRAWLQENSLVVWSAGKAWAEKGTWGKHEDKAKQNVSEQSVVDAENVAQTVDPAAPEPSNQQATHSQLKAEPINTKHSEVSSPTYLLSSEDPKPVKKRYPEQADQSWQTLTQNTSSKKPAKLKIQNEVKKTNETKNTPNKLAKQTTQPSAKPQTVPTTAKPLYENFQAIKPNKLTLLIQSVRKQVWKGEAKEALTSLSQAANENPGNLQILSELGMLLQYMGRHQEADQTQEKIKLLHLQQRQKAQLQSLNLMIDRVETERMRMQQIKKKLEKEASATESQLEKPLDIQSR